LNTFRGTRTAGAMSLCDGRDVSRGTSYFVRNETKLC